MCGRGGVAGDGTPTSQQGCGVSIGREWQQGMENGQRAPRHQAERKTGGPKVWRQKTRSFGPGLKLWRRRKGKESKEGKDFHPGEKSGLEEEWGVEVDLENEVESRKKLDEQRRKLQKELRDIAKFSCVPKEFQENLKSNLQQQLQEVEQRRHGPAFASYGSIPHCVLCITCFFCWRFRFNWMLFFQPSMMSALTHSQHWICIASSAIGLSLCTVFATERT